MDSITELNPSKADNAIIKKMLKHAASSWHAL